MATKVTLRQKAISKGRKSLYLDFYPPIQHPKTGKPTRREFLGIYIIAKPKNALQKANNKETEVLAEQIRHQRENDLNKPEVYNAFEKEQLIIREKGEKDFVSYFRQLANKRKSSNYDNWISALHYLEDFTHGTLKFSDLNVNWANDFRDYLLTTKSRKSDKVNLDQNSAASYFNKLKAALRQAFKDGMLQIDLNGKIEAIKEKETHRAYLTHEELNQLVKTECKKAELKTAALFSALTGLRFSDIQKLIWREIEFSKSQGYTIKFRQKKTGGTEVLHISEQAVTLLGGRGGESEKVIAGLTYSAYQNKFLKEWVQAAGITKHITFHAFRHTYATLQLSGGTDIYTVSKLMGHKNLQTTQIYAKVVDESKRKAANVIKLKFQIMRSYKNHFYFHDLKPIHYCGQIVGLEGTIDEYKTPKDIKPTKGKHDFRNCPNCQKNLEKLKDLLQKKYKGDSQKMGFPFCCPQHPQLITEVKEFKKEDFDKVPYITAHKIIYAYQHIVNNQEVDNWQEDIKDYLDYVVESFGKMPENCGSPLFLGDFLNQIKAAIELNKDIKEEVKKYVLEYIEQCYQPKSKNETSFELLIKTYEKWFETFPFELSLFNDLESHFRNNIPLFDTKTKVNKYTGRPSRRFLTINQINNELLERTNQLVTQINTFNLEQSGQLTEPEKIKIEMAISMRRLKIKKGYLSNGTEKRDYKDMLAEWLEDEIQFLERIKQETQEENILESIWLTNPKVSINEVLQKGFDRGIWDEKHKLQSKKNSLYGTGKTLLSALYKALNGNSIKVNTDYKVVGEKLCSFFQVEIKQDTKEPYKAFQSADPIKIKEFKKLLNLCS